MAASIKNVAIIGASGHIGSHFASSLLETGKHTVTAITRHGSKSTLPTSIISKPIDFDNDAELVTALSGQQFLVITLPGSAPQDLHSRIVRAAIKAGVEYIMPNAFGPDIKNSDLVRDEMLTATYAKLCDEIEQLGGNYVALVCGPWYGWGLNFGEAGFGIDVKNKKVTFFDDGNTKINVSTWKQCGRALAGLVSLPAEEVAKYKNKPLYISSFRISQRDILDSVHRTLGSTDAEWDIQYEDTAKRVADGKQTLAKGDRMGFAKAMYARLFYPNGGSDYENTRELANDVLGLPKEDLDLITKGVLEGTEEK